MDDIVNLRLQYRHLCQNLIRRSVCSSALTYPPNEQKHLYCNIYFSLFQCTVYVRHSFSLQRTGCPVKRERGDQWTTFWLCNYNAIYILRGFAGRPPLGWAYIWSPSFQKYVVKCFCPIIFYFQVNLQFGHKKSPARFVYLAGLLRVVGSLTQDYYRLYPMMTEQLYRGCDTLIV